MMRFHAYEGRVFAIGVGTPIVPHLVRSPGSCLRREPWRLPFFSMLVASSVSERIEQRGVKPFTVRVEAA
jgi:hypothetical protein